MLPTLRPGDIVVTTADTDPPPDSIVVFPHPAKDMWLVKRTTAVSAGEAWVESDNPEATTADSRNLGWVPTTDMYRVILRYRPPLSLTPVRGSRS
jgi:hypothetical protein